MNKIIAALGIVLGFALGSLAPLPIASGDTGSGSALSEALGSGSGSGLDVVTHVPASGLHDPAENPMAALDDAKTLQRAGWPILIDGLLVMITKALAYTAAGLSTTPILGSLSAWLKVGKRAVIVAGVGAVATAVYGALQLGSTWSAVAFTAVVAMAGAMSSTTKNAS